LPWGVWDSSPWWSGRVFPLKPLLADRRSNPVYHLIRHYLGVAVLLSSRRQRQPKLEPSFVRLFCSHDLSCHSCDGFPVFLRPEHQVDEIFLFRPLCRLLHYLESEPIPPGAPKKCVFCVVSVWTVPTEKTRSSRVPRAPELSGSPHIRVFFSPTSRFVV
jgi:hypothetical protein